MLSLFTVEFVKNALEEARLLDIVDVGASACKGTHLILLLFGKSAGDLYLDAEYKIAADSVILSVGYKPAPIAEKAKHVHFVGDCDKVGNLRTVIWQAWDVAMKI